MKLIKPYTNEEYADFAIFCNDNHLVMEDKGDYLEACNPPEKTPEEIKAERIEELKAYLFATDWYAIRNAETGAEIPEEIRTTRQAARDEISALRGDDG